MILGIREVTLKYKLHRLLKIIVARTVANWRVHALSKDKHITF